MVIRKRGQRDGRVFHWVVGVLTLCVLGLVGYHYWNILPRQEQDDQLIEEAQKDRGGAVQGKAADPKDWPGWRGSSRDASMIDDRIRTSWPDDGLPRLWKVAGGGGFSAISVAAGRAVTMIQEGDNEVVLCLDAETGKQKWRFAYRARFEQDGVGPRATPTIDGERVYTLGATGHLYFLNVETGKEVWHVDLQKEYSAPLLKWGFSSSPLIEDELLLCNPGGPGNTVLALDRKTGKEVWKALNEPAGYSSPVISEACGVRQVLFFLGEALVSLDPKTGKELWRFGWDTKFQVNAATAIARGNHVFISSGYGKGSALVRVLKSDDGKLSANRVYKNNLMKNHFGSSVFFKDHVWGFDEGHLTCVPYAEGKKPGWKAWKERRYNKGTLMVAGEHLIVLGEKGNLGLVEPYPDEFRELASFKVTDGRCWTMPVVAQARLYIRDEDSIYCFDLRKP